MAKQGAVDKLVARIDADVAKRTEARDYAGKHGADGKVLDSIDADVAELKRIRDYVTGDEQAIIDKPKRTRKRKGLPTDPATA